MQLFIGGACAGKGDIVTARFPDASWLKAGKVGEGDTLTGWRDRLASAPAVVISGWTIGSREHWPMKAMMTGCASVWSTPSRPCSRPRKKRAGEVVLILPEMGRGIVPLASEERRLRDLAGWFNQDVACRADAVWYVRHGLAQCLKRPC